jgi:HEAT repeat protein
VYNAFVFSRIRRTHGRARALFAMGRSRSPMAVERLARALDDSNPHVREQAVRGLGETRAMEAVPPLVRELTDEESDIRAEAAESLGKLRHPRGIEALLQALDAREIRVAVSAARALGDLGGEEARAKLHERLDRMGVAPDKLLLSTIVESLSRLGDVRVVATALRALEHYASPVIRLQLLNAACRALGARNLFYELVSLGEFERAERLDQMLRSVERRLRRLGGGARRSALSQHLEITRALEEQRYGDMPALTLALAAGLLDEALVDVMVAEPARQALELFVQAHAAGKADLPDVFSVVCLGVIVDAGR